MNALAAAPLRRTAFLGAEELLELGPATRTTAISPAAPAAAPARAVVEAGV